jgi:membrane protein
MAHTEVRRTAEPLPPSKRRRLFASRANATRFLRTLAQRFLNDLCLERAAALSYTAVVSLVPAAAVSLAFLSSLPQSDRLRSDVEDLLTLYLLPNAGEAAVQAFRTFIAKAAGLSALGFLGLAVTAIMLLITVNDAFDAIWRVHRPRPLLIRLLAYGAILTVGPVLIGLALSISGVLLATSQRYGGETIAWSIGWVMPLVPFLLEGAAFTLIYHVVPNCPVTGRDSLAGGMVAALLFEGAKHGFALYILWFPTYNAIYGTLAAIPVLLAWIYLCWIATLVGAELAAALPEWRSGPPGNAGGSSAAAE